MHHESTTSIALGAVLYLRNFFPEDSFEPIVEGGITLRVLRSTTETRKLVGWISEVERNKESIHGVALEIYDAEGGEDRTVPVEVYFLDTGKKPDLRAICKAIQKMDPLSGRFALRIRVCGRSPVRLRGFKKGGSDWTPSGNGTEVSSIRIFRNEIEGMHTEPDGAHTTKGQGTTIDCLCTINTNERDMLQCRRCLGWAHAVCCGYFSSQDPRVPKDFTCFMCMGKASRELRDLCVYRRVLYIAFNEDFSNTDLGERLKITRGMIRKVLSRLRTDGLIRHSAGGHEVVRNKKSREKIREYFNEARALYFVSVGKVECVL